MSDWKVFLRCIGQAVLAKGGRALVGLIPFGEVVYDIASDAIERLQKQQDEGELLAGLQELAQAGSREVKHEAEAIVQQLAASQPQPIRERLTAYLLQVPPAVRQSLRRPEDLSGTTVPASLALQRPEDLVPALPTSLPRFKVGDRPAGVGDWELVELLGSGGFGEVWKACNPHFSEGQPVALKFCLDPTAKDQLLRHEAAVLNQVMRHGRHPGIVQLQHTYLSANPPCLEYEYIAGGELTALIRHSRPRGGLPVRQAARIIHDLAGIVGFAHRLSPPIVHRDLKPANILVQRSTDRQIAFRVADFGIGGIASGRALVETRLATSTGNLLASALRGAGTPLYASPQQVRGEGADPRDDVYALGVIWYQLLTGDLSSGRPGGKGWRRRLAEKGMAEGLIDLLEECFEDDPGERPRDGAILANRLMGLLTPSTPRQLPPDGTISSTQRGMHRSGVGDTPVVAVAAPLVPGAPSQVKTVLPPRTSEVVPKPGPGGTLLDRFKNLVLGQRVAVYAASAACVLILVVCGGIVARLAMRDGTWEQRPKAEPRVSNPGEAGKDTQVAKADHLKQPPDPGPADADGKDGIVLNVKDSVTQLDPVDQVTYRPSRSYEVKLKKGKVYQIDMLSNELRPRLRLVDSAGKQLAWDGGNGSGGSARIMFRCYQDHSYKIFASGQPVTGKFLLMIREYTKQPAVIKLKMVDGMCEVQGYLATTDAKDNVCMQSYAKLYDISMEAGKVYQIDMVSREIDSYLRLENPDGKQLGADDDSGGFPNARITYTCLASGNHRIIALAFGPGTTGSFTLSVREK